MLFASGVLYHTLPGALLAKCSLLSGTWRVIGGMGQDPLLHWPQLHLSMLYTVVFVVVDVFVFKNK